MSLTDAKKKQPEPIVDGTVDLESEPRTPPADATFDLETGTRERPAAPVDATCDLDAPGVPATSPGATCEFSVDDLPAAATNIGAAPHPKETARLNRQGDARERPAPRPEDGTIDLAADSFSEAPAATSGPAKIDATIDLEADKDADTERQRTMQRSSPQHTQPTLPSPGRTAPVPDSAGRYVFKKFHAKGGMGEIWLAEDSDIGRPVALKRMLKGREKHRYSFMKEAQVTGQLEHPGVIPVHELSVDEHGQPYYIMKFVQGQTLKQVIADYHKSKADPNSPREVTWLRLLNIFLDLCQTIAYAHSRGVIHRDIKPDNVMVGAYGETLVLDWGLAKVVNEAESEDPYASIRLDAVDASMASLSGSIKGSPFYFSPEVASGEIERVDAISDIYLLGGTLYEIITGRTPRTATKVTVLIEMAQKEPPAPPRKLDPTVPKSLDAICNKAMAHKKEDRYQTATALAEDLQRYLAGEPVTAYQETFLERSWRWVKKHRTGLTRAAAAAVLLAVGLAAVLLISDANAKSAAALADAALLKGNETARQQIKTFRSAMEEARFFAASADPVAESAPHMDAAKAEARANEAFAVADSWGKDFEAMPLEDKREELRRDVYELLLEVAQFKSRRAAPEQVKEVQALLDRAASVHTPTQSYYRLRARALETLGQASEAASESKRALDPSTPTTAMDHYLLGEQQRVDSLKHVKEDTKGDKQAGIKGLLARRESLDKAIKHYRNALESDPNHYWSHFQLGSCYSGLGSYEQAAEALGTCIALRSDAPWGFSARGLALSQLENRAADAETDLNRALSLNKEFRPARLHRGAVYAKLKKYQEAESDFAAVLAPPNDQRYLAAAFSRGQMNMDRQKLDEALADFDQVIDGNLGIRTAYLHRARIYLVKENNDEVLKNLTLFIGGKDFNAENPQASEQRGRELRILCSEFPAEAKNRRENTYLLALSQLEKAVQAKTPSSSAYDELGSVNEKLAELQPNDALARIQGAIAAYTKGIKLAPKDQKLLAKRGWAYITLGQFKEARQDFTTAAALDPSHAESHTGLGYAEAKLKAPSPARRHAHLALFHGAGDYLVLHNVACIYGALSETDATRAAEYQDFALDHIRHAVDLWKKGGRNGPDLLRIIQDEVAFSQPLRDRPEFAKILQDK